MQMGQQFSVSPWHSRIRKTQMRAQEKKNLEGCAVKLLMYILIPFNNHSCELKIIPYPAHQEVKKAFFFEALSPSEEQKS